MAKEKSDLWVIDYLRQQEGLTPQKSSAESKIKKKKRKKTETEEESATPKPHDNFWKNPYD